MSYIINTPQPLSPSFPDAAISPVGALRRVWHYPYQTLTRLAKGTLGHWLIPMGLALAVFYLRLAVLLVLGQPVSDVTVLRGAPAIIVGWPLAALLLYGCCQWLEAHAQFPHLLLLSMWSTLPLTLRGSIQLLYMLVTGQVSPHAGLSGLLATVDQQDPLVRVAYFLLGQVDLFVLWHLGLLVLTLQVVAGVAPRRAGQGVALYVGFLALLGIVVALLSYPQ